MEKTPYNDFVNNAHLDMDAHHERMRNNGTFEFSDAVKIMEKLSLHMNGYTLVYLFGEQLGSHLWEKFIDNNRNLLSWLRTLTSEYRFFLLHEVKNNPYFYIQGQ